MIWSRYPAKLVWKQKQLVAPPPGYTGRAKKLGQCSYCKEFFAASSLEVDHKSQAGSLNSWESVTTFVQKLLDTNENWVLACKPCHKIKSYAERTSKDFHEALAEKQAIAFLKRDRSEVLAYLQGFGYNANSLKNNQQRRKALVEVFSRRKDE